MKKHDADALAAAFGAAAPDHYAWQTQNPGVAAEERALLEKAFLPLGARVLDLGCGEGATLFHLGEPRGAHGVDLFAAKVEFARQALPRCHFVQASVYELPFEAASFDHVLVRDLIHHLDEPERFTAECARVLSPGGRIDVLEPCRNNPLILLHALTHRVERGELRSTKHFLRQLLEERFDVGAIHHYQALPLHRLVFHPKLGSPRLAERPLARALVGGVERAFEALAPTGMRAYLHLRATLRPQ
ncbi:MAG TPA: class I SAM-dependent methyltransferase [Polyangiaceae bacterium]|nr:class I SAM-dependent methyltransferase [Polyangiaceae bacterium]